MSKVILVLCDGLRYDTAVEMMGYTEHLVESHLSTRYMLQGELPTVSRPMYETIHTGTPVSVHGVTSNWIVRSSTMPSIFSIAHNHTKVTGASAYYWFSELYNGCPYHQGVDREVDDPNLLIQHGRFYTADPMPDEETFNMGLTVISKYQPDFMLIHPMGMDYLGHTYGYESNQYRNNAILIDTILASNIPDWLAQGYQVIITSDHGMSKNNSHAGTLPEVRDVPLYVIQPGMKDGSVREQRPNHLIIAPTILKLMGLPIPNTMMQTPLADIHYNL